MLTLERLKELLSYDPETGHFYWRVRKGSHGKPGRPAGWTGSGYRLIEIDGRTYSAHRLAWLFMNGSWPEQVDHINLDRGDNRWANLRHATRDQNNVNKSVKRTSKSGVKGVRYIARVNRWDAVIKVKGKSAKRHLGRFDSPEEASAAYLKAARELHGEFARG